MWQFRTTQKFLIERKQIMQKVNKNIIVHDLFQTSLCQIMAIQLWKYSNSYEPWWAHMLPRGGTNIHEMKALNNSKMDPKIQSS